MIPKTIFACILLCSTLAVSYPSLHSLKNALIVSAYGDALGRVTEFTPSTEAIFKKYPQGVKTPSDFKEQDWDYLPKKFSSHHTAPYTDDTRMALLVTEVLIMARKHSWNKEQTMSKIAQYFIKDLENNTYGWAASYRAPGNACLKGVRLLARKTARTTGWWNTHALSAGGCGSVMRAFPFGLVFSDDITKAESWAVAHSQITHGHPIALAACAAMAVGTAHSVNGTELDLMIHAMIKTAQKYDTLTAQKMRTAYVYAQQAKALLKELDLPLDEALKNPTFRALHNKVFREFEGWAAHDAIAATVYVVALFPNDISSALYVGVHTQGDSDSIAAMAGALVGGYSRGTLTKSQVNSLEDSGRLNALAQEIVALYRS